MSKQKFVALDTRFILSLEKGEDRFLEVIDFFSQFGWFCIVSETVREELQDIADHAHTPEVRVMAANALKCLHEYNILQSDLSELNRDIAKIVAQKLMDASLIPGGAFNDAMAIAEAAMNNCVFFVTDRESLVKSNGKAIRVAFISQDVPGCEILPMELIHKISKQLKNFQSHQRVRHAEKE